jgi:hypothetical protein
MTDLLRTTCSGHDERYNPQYGDVVDYIVRLSLKNLAVTLDWRIYETQATNCTI